MLVQHFLRRSARLQASTEAVVDGGGAWTFAELEREVERLALQLSALGVVPGDRVAVLARNRREYAALYFSVGLLGAVLVPLNWRLAEVELRWILEHCEPRVLLRDPDLAALAVGADRQACEVRSFEELAAPTADAALDSTASWTDTDLVVQLYTSGTTGKPKGALLSHRNVTSMTQAWLHDMPLRPGCDRFLQVTPLFHVGGMMMLMSCVAAGATLLLQPEFEPAAVLDALGTQGVTHTLLVPAMVQWLLLEPSLAGRSFVDLELIVYGAAPMPGGVLERAAEVFGCEFLQGYGLTETAGVVLTLRPEDHARDSSGAFLPRVASAGRDLLCSEVRVLRPDGQPVEPCDPGSEGAEGEVGEIVVRGDNVSRGYFKDPVATAESYREGWFHTGDLARIDTEGFVYVVDRLRDMLLVGGEKVYPAEVEEALLRHDGVAEAAVIGVPHEVWGEQVLAFVVPVAGGAGPSDAGAGRELVRHCRTRLASFKCPTRIEWLTELPRNAAGKLLKRALREPYWSGRDRNV